MKTVYFLGAGASKELFNFPIMKEFFVDFSFEEYPSLYKFLSMYFSDDSIANLNLEEVITALELSLDKFGMFGKWHPETFIFDARRDFDVAVNTKFKIDPNCGNDEEKLNKLYSRTKILFEDLSKIGEEREKDSVITLNYDLVLDFILFNFADKSNRGELEHETMLERMYNMLGKTKLIHGDKPSLFHKSKNLGQYLKLHGSLDWLYCPNENCRNHQEFFPNRLGEEKIHDQIGEPCILCGAPLISVIIPPTLHKSFEKFPKLGLIWTLAYRELNRADKIIILGVSFTPSDYYLKWLLKSSIATRENKPNIQVINIDSSICDVVKILTGVTPEYTSSFDNFMNGEK